LKDKWQLSHAFTSLMDRNIREQVLLADLGVAGMDGITTTWVIDLPHLQHCSS
jgi:hypothetical protein